MRVIGCLSFPLFAWIFAQNWKRKEDESVKPLITRLMLFGIIAQIPHFLLFGNCQLNILIGFPIVAITFTQVHKSHRKILMLVVGLIISQLLGVSYGWYAIIGSLLMINFNKGGDRIWWMSWSVTNILYVVTSGNLIQIFAIFTPIILLYHNPAKDQKPSAIEKRFFYYFYPIHLAGLAALRTVL